jgi:hypothetical protein
MNKRLIKLALFLFILCFKHHTTLGGLSTLAKNDPYPLFSTAYPYGFLLDQTLTYLKCTYDPYAGCCYKPKDCVPCQDGNARNSHFSLAFSGYYQKANCGRNYDREKVELGDLEGRWNMLGMCYGPVPGAPAFPPTLVGTRLGQAKTLIFNTPPDSEVAPDRILTDSSLQVGFFSVPTHYRKHGVRFELCFQPHPDFGLFVQGGYADIKNTATQFINLTPPCDPCNAPCNQTFDTPMPGDTFLPTAPQFTCSVVTIINELLMSATSANRIFREQGIEKRSNTQNRCDFRESSFEDLRFSVWLRHIFLLNQYNCEWPELALIPFFHVEGSVALERKVDTMRALAVPFGNNGHNSIGFTGGFHIDFFDTIEIGFTGGATFFTPRNVTNYRLPTHETQSGVFPFATNVKVQPGDNHEFQVMLHAYRFLGKLSGHVAFVVVNHAEDSITILDETLRTKIDNTGQPVFKVGQQECLTKFMSQFLTTAGNYEISPNISLGFAVQWPIQQRNAFRSTTVIGTIRGTF